MGIDGFHPLVRTKARTAIEERDFAYFKDMRIAIDTSLVVYKIAISGRDNGMDMVNKNGQLTSHLNGIFYRIMQMVENGITPIFVFDGKAPDLKNAEAERRKGLKEKALEKMNAIDDKTSDEYIKYFQQTFSPTKEDYAELKIMLDLMGIPYIQAPGEADVVLAWLGSRYATNGETLIDGVCSDDSDMLVHGARYLFKDMFSAMKRNPKKASVISLEKILEIMNVDMNQFIDMCVLMGCDFSDRIKDIGSVRSCNLVRTHGSIKKSINELKKKNITVDDDHYQCMKRARNYFRDSVSELDETFKIKKNNIQMRKIQFDALMDYMCNKHNFKGDRIEKAIIKLSICYKKMGITRENTKQVHTISNIPIKKGIDFLPSDSESE